MKKNLRKELEIPKGIVASIENNNLIMKKNSEELQRKLNSKLNVKIDSTKIIVEAEKATKKEKKIFGSLVAHIKNMFIGLNEKFKYRLQVAAVHFPITIQVDDKNKEVIVKNFLGEKKDRKIKIIPGINIKVTKDIIELESSDIEKAGQMAANLEKGTKVRNRDRRVFQDGIFIIEKPGRAYLQ